MLFGNVEHYHITLTSRTIRIPDTILLSHDEANIKLERLIELMIDATNAKIKFSGSGCVLFDTGDHITKYICIGDCLENVVNT